MLPQLSVAVKVSCVVPIGSWFVVVNAPVYMYIIVIWKFRLIKCEKRLIYSAIKHDFRFLIINVYGKSV